MDKRLILAVAGSGKTTYIIDRISRSDRALVITYTENNNKILKDELNKKFQGIPSNIYVTTYFTFLYSFCFLPFFFLTYRPKGLTFDPLPSNYNIPKQNISRYLSKSKYVYHQHLSDFILENNIHDVLKRVEKYFDSIYIDEVQDFASYDFDFILRLTKSNTNVLYLGDFYQHTFDTSHSGTKNCNLYSKGITYYLSKFDRILKIDNETLSKSHRCKKNVCEFISQIGIKIESHSEEDGIIRILDSKEDIIKCLEDNNITKLFYSGHSRSNLLPSNNWGACKGSTYENVCIITTKNIYNALKNHSFEGIKQETINKFYVACSRTKNNLFFISREKYNEAISL